MQKIVSSSDEYVKKNIHCIYILQWFSWNYSDHELLQEHSGELSVFDGLHYML